MLEIVSFELGPVVTNSYLVADTESAEAVVIDPAWNGAKIVNAAQENNWRIGSIWLTHAHFDHLGGCAEIASLLDPDPPIALHPSDMPLWQIQGGATYFGMQIDPGPEPSIKLEHGMPISVGEFTFEVRHTPGHTPGHVIFYSESQGIVFCGDVIFHGSIGRTDLPGGSYQAIINSIRTQILPLADHIRLLPGHGPETTVGEERKYNPFLT